jgi:tetratricopeptide (TPR) repeat protein
MKKTLITTLVLLLTINVLFAQNNDAKARAYFNEAQTAYNDGSYNTAISNLNSVEELLGNTNPVILNLKVKSYFALKDYDKAKQCLDEFSQRSAKADKGLVTETLSYYVKIDKGIAEVEVSLERARLAAKKQREDYEKAELKRKEEARLAEIKKKEDAKRAAEFVGEVISYHKNGALKNKIYYNKGVKKQMIEYNEKGILIWFYNIETTRKHKSYKTYYGELVEVKYFPNGLINYLKWKCIGCDTRWGGPYYSFNCDENGSLKAINYYNKKGTKIKETQNW